ncbi:MAG: aminodeoxychorismate synthase component I [Pseudonocardiaceae bacterium]|nr:aminodeoxychorismate synthase component I [Pseudonocardiaceae bacterium]
MRQLVPRRGRAQHHPVARLHQPLPQADPALRPGQLPAAGARRRRTRRSRLLNPAHPAQRTQPALRVLARRLPGTAPPWQVLRRLNLRARRLGLPAPAALAGDWFGGGAVLAPSVRVEPASGPPPSLPAVTGAPGVVGGGWIGYLGYPGTAAAGRRLPPAAWGWADHVLRYDRDGAWWYEELVDGDRTGRCEQLARLVTDREEPSPPQWSTSDLQYPDPSAYRAAVRRAREQIAAGEIYQVNVCTRFTARFAGDPLDVFATGIARLGPARAAFVTGSWGSVASLSPELFLARHRRTVTTAPIKGTLPRRGHADAANAERLRSSAKDVAENVMIVDMARNDLGRVCETGSVTVPRLLEVQPHPGVWHLVSTVTGRLASADDANFDDAVLLAATFPPASVTGAPKARALEVITALETAPREVYCGAVGLASPVAGTELNVAIRSCEFHGGDVWFGVGGGITTDSDPDAEWAECETKAAPLLALLECGE